MQDPERRQADALLKRALELEDDARERFLDESCRGNERLRALVDRLISAAESDRSPLCEGSAASGPLWQALVSEKTDRPPIAAGDRVDAWQIDRTLGRGGMATVYLARRADGQFEQTVALKVLDAARYLGDSARRFAQERQILATLEHSHIARLIDGGTTDAGQPYVVMEYVDGKPIDRYCDDARLSIERRIELFEQVAGAVEYAHGHLIVHRDIKPSNILVTRDGEPKLLDFGIAKLLDGHAPNAAPETRDALHPMTPEYASPEQLRGEPLTVASDIYQLGFLLYCLLCGRKPYEFEPGNVADIVRVVLSVEPPQPSHAVSAATDAADIAEARSTTPSRLEKQLAGDLDTVVETSLRKTPANRYTSVAQLRDDLRRHREGRPVTARPQTRYYRASKFVRRNRVAVAAAALIVSSIAAGTLSTVWQARETAREAERAAAAFEFLTGLFESVDPDVTLGESVTARDLLDRGAARLDSELAGAPRMRVEMLGVIGGMYTDLGLYDDALPLLEDAAAAMERLDDQDPAAVADIADRLAAVLYEQGRYEEAAESAQRGIALRRDDSRTASGKLAVSIGQLASIRSVQGLFDEADTLYRQALELDRAAGDPGRLASHLSDYSAALYRAGRFEEARETGEEALALHRELYGPAHTLIATSLLNLGTVLAAEGRYDDGAALLQDCLRMRRQLLGDEHPHVALALSNLGNIYRGAGRLDEAEAAHREALAIRRATLGEAHPDYANSLNAIGVVLYFNAQYREAADIFEQVVPLWQEAYGRRHPNVFTALNNLGAALREAGDVAGAERVLRQTLELRREAFGSSHPQVAQSMNNLALLLAKNGANEEAETLIREAVAMWRETMGENHPDVGDGLMSLGRFLLDQDRCEEAEASLQESLDIRRESLDPGAPMLASTRLYLAECLVRLGRSGEAETYLAESLPVLVDRWGDDAEITQRAKRVMAELER